MQMLHLAFSIIYVIASVAVGYCINLKYQNYKLDI